MFLIEVKNLTVRLAGVAVLENVNLEIKPKQIITVVGPNGAGKSTLLKAILGLIKLNDKSSVTWNNNLKIGYVPQSFELNVLLPLTVKDFLKLNLEQTLNLKKLPGQLQINNLMQKSMHELSGGERQRVLLAHALIREPNLLVLDEPTQGVDLPGQLDFYQMLLNIRQNFACGILLVSHDLNFVMAETDYVICLNKHICCQGTPQKVSQDPNFVELFGNLALYPHIHNHKHHHNGII